MPRSLLPVMAWTLSLCALFAGASVMVAAPRGADAHVSPAGHDVQDRPGFPTQARVWIENRGRSESVPVIIQDTAPDASLHVQITGTPSVTIAAPTVLDTRRSRQPWEYLTVSIAGNENPIAKLEKLGAEGWEATGLQFPADGSAARLVLLKRPK